MILAMAGANLKKSRGITEAGYDLSYAVESVALRHFKENNDKDLHDSDGYCLWKEADENVVMHCKFRSEGRSYDYTFKGSNSHDDGPLFPPDLN
jgi:hypothetical protein